MARRVAASSPPVFGWQLLATALHAAARWVWGRVAFRATRRAPQRARIGIASGHVLLYIVIVDT